MNCLPAYPLGHLLMMQGKSLFQRGLQRTPCFLCWCKLHSLPHYSCVEGKARGGLIAHLLVPLQGPKAMTATVECCGGARGSNLTASLCVPLAEPRTVCSQQMNVLCHGTRLKLV